MNSGNIERKKIAIQDREYKVKIEKTTNQECSSGKMVEKTTEEHTG